MKLPAIVLLKRQMIARWLSLALRLIYQVYLA